MISSVLFLAGISFSFIYVLAWSFGLTIQEDPLPGVRACDGNASQYIVLLFWDHFNMFSTFTKEENPLWHKKSWKKVFGAFSCVLCIEFINSNIY